MAIHLKKLPVPDAFCMTQEEVQEKVALFFLHNGWKVEEADTGSGYDVRAEKNGWTAFVKCKGSRSQRQADGMVYDNTQLRSHVADQMEKLVRLQGEAAEPSLFIMANPDLDRVKRVVSKLEAGLDKLDVIRAWAGQDGTVSFDTPAQLALLANRILLEKK